MKPERPGRRSLTAALVLASLVCGALLAPVFMGGARLSPGSSGYVSAAAGDSFPIAAPIVLSELPRMVLERGAISLASDSRQTSPGASMLSLLTGRRSDITLSEARITIYRGETGGDGLAADPGKALAAILASLAKFEFKSLHLHQVEVAVCSPEGQVGAVATVSGDVTHGLNRQIMTTGTIAFNGEDVAFDVAFTRPGPGADDVVPLRATLQGRHISAALDGRVTLGEHFQLKAPAASLSMGNMRAAAQWLGQQWPGGPGLGPFTARGLLVVDTTSAAFENAVISIDGSEANGALSLSLGSLRPSIQGTLAFEELDIEPFVAKDAHATLSIRDWLASLRIPGMAAPSLIREVDADLRLSAKRVAIGPMRLGRFAASVTTNDGKLSGEIADVELESGGNGQGRWSVDMTGRVPRYDVSANLNGVDFGRLAARLGNAVVEGTGNLVADLSGEGTTEADVISSLTGKLALDMDDGGRLGINTEALPGATAEKVPVHSLMTSSTWVDRVVARLSAERGIVKAERLEAWSSGRKLTGEGSVSLPAREVDLTLSLAPASGSGSGSETPQDQAKQEPAPASVATPAAEGSRVAFRVSGPWSAPAVSAVKDTEKPSAPAAADPSLTPAPALAPAATVKVPG